MRHSIISIRKGYLRTYRVTGLIFLGMVYALIMLSAVPVTAGELSNIYCPVTTSELAEEQFSLDYQGQTIYFCCNKCKKDFLSNPELYLANLEAPIENSDHSETSHDHDDGAHEHGENAAEVSTDAHDEKIEAAHDHATDHGESSSLVTFAGKFHPMLTHFPIALVFSALLFSILAAIFKMQTMDYVSVYSIYLAALTGIGTVILGLAAGSAASYPSFLIEFLSWHRLLGIATGIVTLLTAYMGRRHLLQSTRGSGKQYMISLIVNTIMVGVTGHFGSLLVF